MIPFFPAPTLSPFLAGEATGAATAVTEAAENLFSSRWCGSMRRPLKNHCEKKPQSFAAFFIRSILSFLITCTSEGGSDATLHTMETFLPLGTVRYMEVGDSCGAQANSARDKEGTCE